MINNGVLLSPPDPRDYPVSAVADVSKVDIPADFEVWQPPVENQGGAGNCVAQSCANIMECIAHEYGEDHRDYSVGFIFGSSMNTASSGMYPREACEIMLKQGDVLREDWECKLNNPACKSLWRQQVTEDIKARAKKVMAYVRIHTKEEMQTFMLKYNLPVMIISKTDAFYKGSEGRHATVCYGWISEETYRATPTRYNDYNEDEYEDLLFTNSWGLNYHNNGRGTCKFSDMEEVWGLVPIEKIKLKDIENSWAKKDIEELVELGIVKGDTEGNYRPADSVRRDEMAALLMRVIRRQESINKGLTERIAKLESKLM